jgi:hypothetical protein
MGDHRHTVWEGKGNKAHSINVGEVLPLVTSIFCFPQTVFIRVKQENHPSAIRFFSGIEPLPSEAFRKQ